MSVQNDSTNPLRDAALYYAHRGNRVLPLVPGTKIPLLRGWPENASTDPKKITQWWSQEPSANIGILPREDELFLDIDRKDGKPNGFKTLKGLLQGNTPIQRSPNNGSHVVLKDPGIKLKKLPGVDVQQNSNAYIAAAPSIVEGKPYVWSRSPELPVQPMSPELLARFKQSTETPVENSDPPPPLLETPPELPLERLNVHHRRFLTEGKVEGYPSRSELVLGFLTCLYQLNWGDDAVLTAAWSNPYVQQMYLEHRHDNESRALTFLWNDCKKARAGRSKSAEEVFTPVEGAVKEPKEPETPDYVVWTQEALAVRRSKRGMVASAPRPELISFADLSFEGGPEWLIDGLIPEQGIGQLFGDASQGKSFIAIDQACSVATGRPFHGREVSEPGLAVYLAGEGEDALKYRIEAWRRHHGVETEALRSLVLHGWLDFTDGRKDESTGLDPLFDLLYRASAKVGRLPGIVFVDTQSTFLNGSDSDNSVVNPFLRRMREVSRHFGCVVVSVAHVGHSEKHRARGSSSQGGDIDFSYIVERVVDGTLPGEKVTEMAVGKPFKDGEPSLPVAFQWNLVKLEGITDRKGRTRDSLVFTETKEYRRKGKSSPQKNQGRTIMKLTELAEQTDSDWVEIALLKEALVLEFREKTPGEPLPNYLKKDFKRHIEAIASVEVENGLARMRVYSAVSPEGFQAI